jgi:hypothetical protein
MGKLKGKIVTNGDNGMLSYINTSGVKVDVKYDQPFSLELGIVAKTSVSFDLLPGDSMAVAVVPIRRGNIVTMDPLTGTGTLIDTEFNVTYPFKQNYLKESGFALGKTVTYTLVNVKGVLYATALEA